MTGTRGQKLKVGRSIALSVFVALLLTFGVPTEAQQPKKVPQIGFLLLREKPTPTTPDPSSDAFRRGLRDLGYIEGENILMEYRYAGGKLEVARLVVDECLAPR